MNYNTWPFWLLFLLVLLPYWRLDHKRQNLLLLLASYVFYGSWDYRFLTLVFIATVIDYIGGLGVAGIELSWQTLAGLGAAIVASVGLLCTGIQYPAALEAIRRLDGQALLAALPGTWSSFYLPLATLAGTAAYLGVVRRLYRRPEAARRKLFVAFSLTANLTMLGFFKYCDFFVHNLQHLLEQLGLGWLGGSALGIVLPPGISFYTFQAMSYTVDIYRGHARPTRSFSDFALFICFFPHLVAGPIMRASTLLPQVVRPRCVRPKAGRAARCWFWWACSRRSSLPTTWRRSPAMCSSSSSTARAVRSAPRDSHGPVRVRLPNLRRLLRLLEHRPGDLPLAGLRADREFPLAVPGRQPVGLLAAVAHQLVVVAARLPVHPAGRQPLRPGDDLSKLALTMLLGGLWHGANWTFLAWGFYQGAMLCVFRLLGIGDPAPGPSLWQKLQWCVRVVLMFHLTCFGWLLFRADSLATVGRMCTAFAAGPFFTPAALPPLALIVFFCLPGFLIECFTDGENRLDRLLHASWGVQSAVVLYWVLMLLFCQADRAHEFIYFQF